ncbi:ribitol-5-phosphate dehydrogenase [uncultured Methanobrevibacter sp.]|uniref:ribitol-5-phosphate dehydrogenase n=1 Tax=uncultured Methanobrevibacter sp. TaxID=253161 RepID=UPI00260F6340|nr:ribitol-5-phosphate dehydrogenase [uncultured Methanobrevibacter sp.]
MINVIYRLVAPKFFEEAIEEIDVTDGVIVRPMYLSICQADQRYYQGKRASDVLEEKLPMALIHEGIGKVIFDSTGNFNAGDIVVMIPNTPTEHDEYVSANYLSSSKFRGSGFDGFTCDLIKLNHDRLVKLPYNFNLEVSSFIELISVICHGIFRFEKSAIKRKNKFGVWGDGNLGYITALLLNEFYPESEVIVIGKHSENLNLFSFADKVYKFHEIPNDLTVDHGFECVGSNASQAAIDQIINVINPQGSIILFGVSEYSIPINTRLILEKGLIIQGISRSERKDFLKVVEILKNNPKLFNLLENLINNVVSIESLNDLKEAFDKDYISGFGKTILKWDK